MNGSPLGLYVHVPFCAAICSYCNFNRGLFDAALKARYVDAVEREVAACAASLAGSRHPALDRPLGARRESSGPFAADTLFFGGGTPSLLEPAEIARLVAAARRAFDLHPHAEITLEANPDTVTAATLAAFRAAGVTRLSLGVQSFEAEELGRLGRIHSVEGAVSAFRAARDAGFDNISLDLMMWLPGQTLAAWQRSVARLIDLAPEHASLYLLELYPNAPLREVAARAGWSQAPDEEAADMYLSAVERLTAAGFEHYEISNFARPGRRARHNLKYWQDGEWLAFGCGAHSTFDGVRWKNVSATGDYVRRVAAGEPLPADLRELAPAERLEDALFMGLRLVEGLDLGAVNRRYGVDVWARWGAKLADFLEAGLLVREGDRLRLTREGLLMSNEVMAVFIDGAVR